MHLIKKAIFRKFYTLYSVVMAKSILETDTKPKLIVFDLGIYILSRISLILEEFYR